MPDVHQMESGRMGRVAYGRIGPNEDVVQGIEKLCLLQGFSHAFVRGALGSLLDACLLTADGHYLSIPGPVSEIVSLAGEVRAQGDGSVRASVSGVVVDSAGAVHGGPLVSGANTVCVTLEVTLEEWLPQAPSQA